MTDKEYEKIDEHRTAIEKDIVIDNVKPPSDLIQSLTMLLDEKNIKGKTILNNRQVTALTLMNWAGQVYDIPFLNDFVKDWTVYRISGDNGKGRNDLIEIAKAIQLQKKEDRDSALELLRR
jgi:hypothetical protein